MGITVFFSVLEVFFGMDIVAGREGSALTREHDGPAFLVSLCHLESLIHFPQQEVSLSIQVSRTVELDPCHLSGLVDNILKFHLILSFLHEFASVSSSGFDHPKIKKVERGFLP
jgi:hypothetical protein